MIQLSLGNADAARRDLETALSINPHFSFLHAPTATEVLATLRLP